MELLPCYIQLRVGTILATNCMIIKISTKCLIYLSLWFSDVRKAKHHTTVNKGMSACVCYSYK